MERNYDYCLEVFCFIFEWTHVHSPYELTFDILLPNLHPVSQKMRHYIHKKYKIKNHQYSGILNFRTLDL